MDNSVSIDGVSIPTEKSNMSYTTYEGYVNKNITIQLTVSSCTFEYFTTGREIEKYIDNKIQKIIDAAPEQLNTLNELSAALNDDANFAATITKSLGDKVDKVNGKDLSTNDFTDEYKDQIDNNKNAIEENKEQIKTLKYGEEFLQELWEQGAITADGDVILQWKGPNYIDIKENPNNLNYSDITVTIKHTGYIKFKFASNLYGAIWVDNSELSYGVIEYEGYVKEKIEIVLSVSGFRFEYFTKDWHATSKNMSNTKIQSDSCYRLQVPNTTSPYVAINKWGGYNKNLFFADFNDYTEKPDWTGAPVLIEWTTNPDGIIIFTTSSSITVPAEFVLFTKTILLTPGTYTISLQNRDMSYLEFKYLLNNQWIDVINIQDFSTFTITKNTEVTFEAKWKCDDDILGSYTPNGSFCVQLERGNTVTEFEKYGLAKITKIKASNGSELIIPEEILNLPEYGYYNNYIEWRPELGIKRFYNNETQTFRNLSNILSNDNLLLVKPGDTITFENERGQSIDNVEIEIGNNSLDLYSKLNPPLYNGKPINQTLDELTKQIAQLQNHLIQLTTAEEEEE